jgi:hypothetical protein
VDRAALAYAGAGLLVAGALVVLATGTGRPGREVHGPAVDQGRDVPPGVQLSPAPGGSLALPTTSPAVGWDGPGRLVVVTYGSGSCPTYPLRPVVMAPQHLRVPLEQDLDDHCTLDLGRFVSTVQVPSPGVDPALPVTVSLVGGGWREDLLLPP